MIKSRLTLTLLAASVILAAAWPFRYQLYLHLPSEPAERLQVRDGLYWHQGKLFTGRMTETDMLKAGGLMTVTPVIDGLKEGRAVTFDEREAVGTAHWEAGRLEGPFERRSRKTGAVLEEANYQKGVLEGERRLFDEKGALLRVETYAKGELEGSVKTYSPEGGLLSDVEYKAGRMDGKSRRYGPEGRLLETYTYVSGVRQGPFELNFEETGEPAVFGQYENDAFEGRVTTVKPDGSREVRSFVRGVETGPVERYDREGRRIEEGAEELEEPAQPAPDAPVEVHEAEAHLEDAGEP